MMNDERRGTRSERPGTSETSLAARRAPFASRLSPLAVIGDMVRSDFQNVIRCIRAKTAAIFFDNLALFLQTDGLTRNYDLIFLLESGFLQYSLRDIQRLQARWPLARIVMIAGSLAEGEGRTGWLPPELIRCSWHQWETEAAHEFAAFCEHRPASWGLPPTASDEERLGFKLRASDFGLQKARFPMPAMLPKSVILADDPAMREMLADWVTQEGFDVTSTGQSHLREVMDAVVAGAVYFDVASEDFAETTATAQFLKKRWPSACLTVFYNAPRSDEIRLLTQAGVNRVVAKPFFF